MMSDDREPTSAPGIAPNLLAAARILTETNLHLDCAVDCPGHGAKFASIIHAEYAPILADLRVQIDALADAYNAVTVERRDAIKQLHAAQVELAARHHAPQPEQEHVGWTTNDHHCKPPLGNPTREEAVAEVAELRKQLAEARAPHPIDPQTFAQWWESTGIDRHSGAYDCWREDQNLKAAARMGWDARAVIGAEEVSAIQETRDEEMAHSIARAVADAAYAEILVIGHREQGRLYNLTRGVVLDEFVRRKGAK